MVQFARSYESASPSGTRRQPDRWWRRLGKDRCTFAPFSSQRSEIRGANALPILIARGRKGPDPDQNNFLEEPKRQANTVSKIVDVTEWTEGGPNAREPGQFRGTMPSFQVHAASLVVGTDRPFSKYFVASRSRLRFSVLSGGLWRAFQASVPGGDGGESEFSRPR
jgi:hypothetical protein